MFLYCDKRECRISVSVCLNRGCSHIKQAGEGYLCRFIRKKDLAVKKRLEARKEER